MDLLFFAAQCCEALNPNSPNPSNPDPALDSKEIVPGVVRCFASQDRATRFGLLQNLHTFAHHLTPQLVEKEIYPAVSSGFTDSVPGLRELSLMSMVHLVPKLSEKIINSQVCLNPKP